MGSFQTLQMMGGAGYVSEGMEHLVRKALPTTIYGGTSEIQREIIGSSYGLSPTRSRGVQRRESGRGGTHADTITFRPDEDAARGCVPVLRRSMRRRR